MKMGSNSRLVLFLQKGQTICKTLDSFYAKLMLVSFSNHIKFRAQCGKPTALGTPFY